MDIAGRCIVAKFALRLREAGLMKRSEQGQGAILSSFSCIPENLDHCVTAATRGGFFSAHIPTRDFTDGSEFGWKVGGGVFCKELSVSLIKVAVEILLLSAALRTVLSKLVKECLSSLEIASGYFNIRLV